MNTSLTPIVSLVDGTPLVSSITIADHFEKPHCRVMHAIKNTLDSVPEQMRESNFRLTQTDVPMPAGGARKSPSYMLTRDGFTLIVMGFTGKKALEWKIRYIEAFNAMERELMAGPRQGSTPLPSDPITPAQRRHLHDVMDAKCSILPKELGGKARAEGWSRVGRKFSVAKYEQLTQAQFDEALNYLISMEFRTKAALPEAPRFALPAGNQDLKAMATEYYHAVMDLSYQWNKMVANVERLGSDLTDAIMAAVLSLPTAGSSPEAIVAQGKFRDSLRSSPRCASRSMDVSIIALIDHAQFMCGLTLLGR